VSGAYCGTHSGRGRQVIPHSGRPGRYAGSRSTMWLIFHGVGKSRVRSGVLRHACLLRTDISGARRDLGELGSAGGRNSPRSRAGGETAADKGRKRRQVAVQPIDAHRIVLHVGHSSRIAGSRGYSAAPRSEAPRASPLAVAQSGDISGIFGNGRQAAGCVVVASACARILMSCAMCGAATRQDSDEPLSFAVIRSAESGYFGNINV
jgi:hypothetical protein